MITVTRKIQVLFDVPSDEVKATRERWWGYQAICHKAANMIASHAYLQEQVKDFHYFEGETKKKLANIAKDADGILTMSRDNTTYSMLSKHFKGECPMGMLSGLNMVVMKTFKQESLDIKLGKKSLRSYRREIPMPVRMGDVSSIAKTEDGNYTFFVYGTPFRTHFGRDLSGNEIMFDRAIKGEYKLCDSSIQMNGGKVFLLAVFQFEKQSVELDADKELVAELDAVVPIKFSVGTKQYEIGNKEEFLYRRIAIQQSLRRAQIASRFNKSGKGRTKKMQAIEHYHKLEDNYVDTRIHQYTAKLIDWALKLKCGKIVLANQQDKEADAKSDEQFLLRNWTYFGMKEKLGYKCRKFGIELIVL